MRYWAPYNGISGNINSNDGYEDGDPATGRQGSIPTFRPFEQMQRELCNLVTKSGLTLDAALDGVQVAQAIQSGMIVYGVDTGSADSLAVTLDPAPGAYSAGMRFLVKKMADPNATTAPTLSVNGLAAIVVKARDSTTLSIGALHGDTVLDLIFDGTNFRFMGVLASDINAAASYVSRMQVFTASGTFTVPAGVTAVQVEVIGGGGGGGASGDGGGGGIAGNAGAGAGGGGYARKNVTGLTPGGTVAVTVGAAGITAVSNNSTNGGTSSFGAFCSCTGGARGQWGSLTDATGGSGGTATGGDINIPGAPGSFSGPNINPVTDASHVIRSYFSGGMAAGGLSLTNVSGSGSAGAGYGGGASGATGGNNIIGGNGAPGIVIVRW